jgi:AcrR family transcriptional regulator
VTADPGPIGPDASIRQTPKARATRARVLDSARRLFVERGYDAVSITDIAAVGDMTKGAVYGHFRSKGHLLIEVIRNEMAIVDEVEDPPPDAPMRASVSALVSPRRTDLRLLEVDAAAAARHDQTVADGLRELYRERRSWMEVALSAAADPESVAWFIEVLARGIGTLEATGQPLLDVDTLESVLRAVLSGPLGVLRPDGPAHHERSPE